MKSFCVALCLSVSGLLTACGGQGAGQDDSRYLTGVAFDAQPFAGALVSAQCRKGSGRTKTQADGKFNIAVRELELPCMLELSMDGGKQKLHAVSMQGEAVNITTLTELLTSRVLRSDLTDFFTQFDADFLLKKVNSTSIKAAEEEVKGGLHNVLKLSMLSDFYHLPSNLQVPDLYASYDQPKTVTYADKLGVLKQELDAVQFARIASLMRQVPEINQLEFNIETLLLIAAKQKWEAANLQNYHYSYGYLCECMPHDAITIVVRNGRVTEAYTKSAHLPIDRGINDKNIKTMKDIFGFAEQAYAVQASSVRFTFDTQYGYPKNIYVDYNANTADEELHIEVFDFGLDWAYTRLLVVSEHAVAFIEYDLCELKR